MEEGGKLVKRDGHHPALSESGEGGGGGGGGGPNGQGEPPVKFPNKNNLKRRRKGCRERNRSQERKNRSSQLWLPLRSLPIKRGEKGGGEDRRNITADVRRRGIRQRNAVFCRNVRVETKGKSRGAKNKDAKSSTHQWRRERLSYYQKGLGGRRNGGS